MALLDNTEERVDEPPRTPPPSRRVEGTVQGILSLLDAVSDLVAATGDLVSEHLELARLELREDVIGIINRAVLLVAILLMLFFGYCLLLGGTIFLLGWGWGIPGMAIGALILAFVHLGVTIPQAKKLASRLRKPAEFKRTKTEIETTRKWMSKQIESSNSKNQSPDKRLSKSPSLKS